MQINSTKVAFANLKLRIDDYHSLQHRKLKIQKLNFCEQLINF